MRFLMVLISTLLFIGQPPVPVQKVVTHFTALTGLTPLVGIPIRASDEPTLIWVATTFSSAALDCPQPGVSAAPQPVAGYYVGIRAKGIAFDYRVDVYGRLVLCHVTFPKAKGG